MNILPDNITTYYHTLNDYDVLPFGITDLEEKYIAKTIISAYQNKKCTPHFIENSPNLMNFHT